MMNNFHLNHNGNNKIYNQMALRFAQQYFEESRIDRKFNHHRLRTQLEQVNAYSVNVDFEKSMERHIFYYGAEYVINDVISTGSAIDIRNNDEILVPDRYPESKWQTYAAYLNYQYLISEKTLIQTGIRHSYFDINSDFSRHLDFYPFDFAQSTIQNFATTASLGMVLSPNKSWKISANASTGFRAPNVDDIGKIFDFADGEVVVPNTSLKAEYVYNAEISISKVFDDFVKFDFRVGQIVEAGKHPDADKLLVLKVQIGDTQKQIVAGIAKYYEPEKLIGKKVVVVNNLQPVTLRGQQSEGMILCASHKDQLSIVTPEDSEMYVGARVK